MPDNWGFVAAAYGLAALVLGGYWRYLRRRERSIRSKGASTQSEGASTAPSEPSPRNSPDSGGKAAARTARDRA